MSESHEGHNQDQVPGDSGANAVQKAELIWDEYKYRHDLIWRHLIRSTAAIVALLTVQFAVKDATPLLIGAAFAIAILYTAFTWWILGSELALFEPVKEEYGKRQSALFDLNQDRTASECCKFACRVRLYILALLLLAILATAANYVWPEDNQPAPDGSETRLLPTMNGAVLAYCILLPGGVSKPIYHNTAEETWSRIGGEEEVWRKQDVREDVSDFVSSTAKRWAGGNSLRRPHCRSWGSPGLICLQSGVVDRDVQEKDRQTCQRKRTVIE